MSGLDKLKDLVKYIPNNPGVYKMINNTGEIIYIGKARNLKNRLTSYTNFEQLSNRIKRMVFEINSLEIIETSSESEALLLESNLIKSSKPKYNVKLKDDSSYPFIAIPDNSQSFPKIYRGNIKNSKDKLFGPFPNAKDAQKTLEQIVKIFKLRTCSNSEYKNRQKPCLRYDIGLCSAPCVKLISDIEYAESCQQAQDFLNGKSHDIIKTLEKKMHQASLNLDYEKAANYRDKLKSLNTILQSNSITTTSIKDADFLALHQEGGKACAQLFVFNNGMHRGNKKIIPTEIEEKTNSEIMKYVMMLHYQSHQIPKYVYVSDIPEDKELLEQAFNTKIINPKRGKKAEILEKAKQNAISYIKTEAIKHKSIKQQLDILAEILNLNKKINRIEMFDVSNISGTNAVASMVVATDSGMQPSQYRKFAIKGKNTPDDYSMMYEALTRRYSRVLKENLVMPDVVMVDGGLGHLHILEKAFKDLKIDNVCLCAIAKGEFRDKGLEKIYQQGISESLPIEFNSPLIFLLQNIRDESHRTAIGYHRKLRSKAMIKSALDEIPGVGAVRKKALLSYFGGITALKNASVKDIAKVNGISQELAKTIYNIFH